MFSYYGSKSKIVNYYPPPKYSKIIEPFCGSARYSLKYWQKDILLVDKYDVIINVWHYLQQCSESDIIGLPKMKQGDNVDNYDISDIEKTFLGFIITRGVESPRKNVSSFVGEIETKLKDIAKNIHKIKHWKIIQDDYINIKNEDATWFIDPPYQWGGDYYKESNKNIDFKQLAEWCRSRNGQAIVCENTKADWLPFKPMIDLTGTKHKTTEAIWSNIKTNFDDIQQNLFD